MTWVAVAIAGSAIIGGVATASAANTQKGAANQATGLQAQQFGQTRADLAPWLNTGNRANKELEYLLGLAPNNAGAPGMGQGPPAAQNFNPTGQAGSLMQPFGLDQFHESPAYQFNLSQGMQAINKASAARGNFYAPQTLQDIGKYTQGMASNEFQNAYNMYNQDQSNLFNRLYGLSGAGQNAAAQTGGFGANFANNAAQNMIGAGNAQAAGYMGLANIGSGAALGLANLYDRNQFLNSLQASYAGNTYGYNPSTGLSTQY